MKNKNRSQARHYKFNIDWTLTIILVIALVLYGYGIWKTGSANDFYTSAITSMTQSFKNFWYASFDPAGYITVDKPPVALWFMVISAKIFGVSNFSVVLPSVLFGVGSVYLMYRLIKPKFGKNAGRIAAFVMTIIPIVVADSRTNNMDATLVYFLLLSLWMLQKAVDKKNIFWLMGSFALIGFAFNIKMLQAFMIVPAMLLFYWIASKTNWKQKTMHTVLAIISLVVLTLAWPLSVDMTSANNRPYEGGSEHNSVMELAFGYNGTQRLLGQTTGTGGTFKGMGNQKSKNNQNNNNQPTPPNMSKNNQQKGRMKMPGGNKPAGMKNGGAPGGVGGGSIFNIGTAGPLRLFQSALGPQISWLLPFAIIGMIASYIVYADPRRKWYQTTEKQKQIVLWTGWLVLVGGFFSVASFFHPYYTIMLAPAIAALSGIGLMGMLKALKVFNRKDIRFYFLPLAIAVTAMLQAWYVSSYYSWLTILILVIGITASLGIIFIKSKKIMKNVIIAGLITIAIAPSFWSMTPTIAKTSDAIPSAGPDLLTSNGNQGGIGSGSVNNKLLKYLQKNQGNAKYLFATADSGTAAPYIIKTKKAVMAMGGFNGTDPAMTLSKFKQLVKSGQVKYYLDGGKSGSTNSSIVNWIKKHGKKVSAKTYGDTSTSNNKQGHFGNKQKTGMPNQMMPRKSSKHQMNSGPQNSSEKLYDLSNIYK
ncbi:ArnT family glycosyltransferase [Apilactobacillus micheneri]|uniref:ArnT family glycosyltransferase n=1 Tax=Apilactobacillus micheneri TaxID=1899430 RepID=UPI00112AA9FD|nr:glycosyltransferase family 39 protein [Apilactobacillus micheneri]TPR45708.1 glycosyltransferase family 39 protein [Apilactobacillus micheneri]TPR49155.1 glycosyltransferase family 39 protein [Apilactobacillus micheneri]TPR52553.1 glycosyltransferase family 39 protein [Apilactobacillus micheneri]